MMKGDYLRFADKITTLLCCLELLIILDIRDFFIFVLMFLVTLKVHSETIRGLSMRIQVQDA